MFLAVFSPFFAAVLAAAIHTCKKLVHCKSERTSGVRHVDVDSTHQFDGWLIHSSLVADLRFRLDLLFRFDVHEAASFIIGWCYALCGG